MKHVKLTAWILIAVMLVALVLPIGVLAKEEGYTTVIAGSDFQHPNGVSGGLSVMSTLFSSMKKDGITKADGFFFTGDYDKNTYGDKAVTQSGVNAVINKAGEFSPSQTVLIKGNHDSDDAIKGLASSGANDPESGQYGVFVINESDYMWYNSEKTVIENTAQNLVEYLNLKLKMQFDKPIFVLSHLGLHYSMRTQNDGDGKYADLLFDVLNEAAGKGLNIVFLYGHDHSNGWDDYLGGSSVFLKKGDSILIARSSQVQYQSRKLNFYYMNAGYVGYYDNHNGADDTLTMTAIRFNDEEMIFSRYDAQGLHALKSEGKRNDYKNEKRWEPNPTVYASPLTVPLSRVRDISPLPDVIETVVKEGNTYQKITALDKIQSGRQYLLFYAGDDYSFMVPEAVTKSNGSSERRGFDLVAASEIGAGKIYGEYDAYEWTLTEENGGWLLEKEGLFAALTDDADLKIVADLSENGDVFTISQSSSYFTFSSGSYVLNYNGRGLINGYANNPAAFMVYERHTHEGTLVPEVPATTEQEGMRFYYVCDCGALFSDSTCQTTVSEDELKLEKLPAVTTGQESTTSTPSTTVPDMPVTTNDGTDDESDGILTVIVIAILVLGAAGVGTAVILIKKRK